MSKKDPALKTTRPDHNRPDEKDVNAPSDISPSIHRVIRHNDLQPDKRILNRLEQNGKLAGAAVIPLSYKISTATTERTSQLFLLVQIPRLAPGLRVDGGDDPLKIIERIGQPNL